MIFPKYLYKRVKHNKGMICSKEEFKSPPFNKEKNSLELQNTNYAHIWPTRKELELIHVTASYSMVCELYPNYWWMNKWNDMEKESVYFILF